MKSETTNNHQENENSDVILTSHEEKVSTSKEISEYWNDENEVKSKQDQILFMNQSTNESKINDKIVDSGTSYHMTNSLEGMTDLKDNYTKIKIGSGKTMLATKRGTYERMVVSKDNKKMMKLLKNVRYVPEMFCKFISPTQAMRSGYEVLGRFFYHQKYAELVLTELFKVEKVYCQE